ncbi:MAG: PmoA family protein, partial [Draconibacterium sp.]|nr:PmoA family protein [Draconibacterium sp.]
MNRFEMLYPIFTSAGTEITRGFPIAPKTGERADHPHQIGMWLTYGNVNGLDFWGNGSRGLGTKNPNGGTIKHVKTEDISGGVGFGRFVSFESWIDTTGTEILQEKTDYLFAAAKNIRIIDRLTTLTAGKQNVEMPDTKEGMFGIRVARQLELSSNGTVELYNADATITKVKDTLNIGITGNYISSEGVEGEAVWGTRARWMKLDGKIGDEQISVVICDHSENPNYPTYWHARGYGLFAANPLGVKDFTKEKENLNFSIPAGKSATFRYRVIICSGEHITKIDIEKYS